MSYTIDITDCPTGTYSKVRTLLVASAEDYEYDKPVFSFLADDEQLAAVQAGVEDLEGVSVGGLLPEVATEVEPEAEPEAELLPAQDQLRFEIYCEGSLHVAGRLHPLLQPIQVLNAHAPEGGTILVFDGDSQVDSASTE